MLSLRSRHISDPKTLFKYFSLFEVNKIIGDVLGLNGGHASQEAIGELF